MEKVSVTFRGNSYSFATHGRGDRISRRLSEGRFHEYRTLNAIRRLGAKGVYIDIGAHIGNHAVFFGCECPSTEVIAFEAAAENRRLLEENLRTNLRKPCRVQPELVGRDGETFDLKIVDEANTGSFHAVPGSEITAAGLDTLFPDLTGVALIKLDIEGGELAALEGGLKLIERNLPVLVTECGTPAQENEIAELLARFRYRKTGSYNRPPNIFWRARRGLFGRRQGIFTVCLQ